MTPQIKSEIEFLRTYYKFYVEKNGSDIEFSKNVIDTLIKTGQVSKEGLEYFIKIITLENEISNKNKEILKMKKELEKLSETLKNLIDPPKTTC